MRFLSIPLSSLSVCVLNPVHRSGSETGFSRVFFRRDLSGNVAVCPVGAFVLGCGGWRLSYCFRFLKNSRNALTTATNGVATIPTPSTISSKVKLSRSVGMVIWAGIIWGAGVGRGAGGEVDELSVEGSGEGSEDTARSVFGLDVGDELPTVMFLTVSALTVKLYS